MLSLLACAPLPIKAPDRQLSYTILMNGQKAGYEIDKFSPDGTVQCDYTFNDRGRGPTVTATYMFGSSGLPTQVQIKGVNYYKANVSEHFELADGNSKWDSKLEHGQGKNGFYISNDGSNSFEMATLVKCLLKSHDHRISLLPAGEAQLQKVASATVRLNRQSMRVTEYAITGLYFSPSEIWVDQNGDYFGSPGAWGASFREGWEGCNAQLLKIQDHYDQLRLQQKAKSLAHRLSKPVAITHVRVFDSVQAATRDDQTVVIREGKIAAVGGSSSIRFPSDATVIDGSGKTLVPGLFDVHVHTSSDDGIFDIMAGVTGVRDMGNDIDALSKTEKAWNDGTIIGPRLWKAGMIDGRGPYQVPTGLYADSLEEALAAVNRYAKLGYVQIKLYSSLNPKFVPEIAKLAHQHGLRLSGHVPDGLTAAQFVQDGADEIQHMNFVMLNFMADRKMDTRTPQRFTEVGKYAGDLDLDSKQVRDFISLLLEHHTTLDLTLGVFEPMYLARPGEPSPEEVPLWDRLPVLIRRGGLNGGLPAEGETVQRYAKSYDAFLHLTKKLYDAGVTILAGTDGAYGFGLHRELELEVRAGIPPAKALQIATWNAAKVLKQDHLLGSIEKGKLADLYLVEGDPTQNISDIRRSRLTFKGGVMYDCGALYSSLGVVPAK